ncbi:hypothetical protein CEXT_433681 [Caerostris extrusa]|uniref:Uncharacterized protein n=1 Tax=Caerostris extrusa TaxID=172846 RepID=A0AAV4TMN1_CAEEX|nr:hypothetical protein CEXT_433681 [Caerostris extrusa]
MKHKLQTRSTDMSAFRSTTQSKEKSIFHRRRNSIISENTFSIGTDIEIEDLDSTIEKSCTSTEKQSKILHNQQKAANFLFKTRPKHTSSCLAIASLVTSTTKRPSTADLSIPGRGTLIKMLRDPPNPHQPNTYARQKNTSPPEVVVVIIIKRHSFPMVIRKRSAMDERAPRICRPGIRMEA